MRLPWRLRGIRHAKQVQKSERFAATPPTEAGLYMLVWLVSSGMRSTLTATVLLSAEGCGFANMCDKGLPHVDHVVLATSELRLLGRRSSMRERGG